MTCATPVQVCFEGTGPRREPHDDREAARSHAGADHRAVCSPCSRFNPECRLADHREHRRKSHSKEWLMIVSHIAPLPCPKGTRPAFLPPRTEGAMFRVSERCAQGSAKPADIGLGQPGPMFACGGASRQSSRTGSRWKKPWIPLAAIATAGATAPNP